MKRKRYKNIYGKKNRKFSFVKIAAAVLGLFVISLVGYAVSTAVIKFVQSDLTFDTDGNNIDIPSSDIPHDDNSDIQQESSQISSEQHSSNSETPKPSSLGLSGIHGTYMPTATLLDDTLFDEFVKQTGEKGFNAIVFDLKDSTGHVYYDSQNDSVLTAGAKVTSPVNLMSRAAKIKEAGLTPIARIYAFKDSVASFVLPESFVWYQSPGTRWVDNYIDQGGKPWLNPESRVAQDYIKEIALEIVKNGVTNIIVDGITYPTGVALETAYYGDRSKNDRLGVLNDFAKDMQKALSEAGGTFTMMDTSAAFLTDNSMQYGGNPVKIDVDSLCVSIFPSDITAPLDFNGQLISLPLSMPKETTELIVKSIKAGSVNSELNILAFVQYYDGYENGDYEKQLTALEENNVSSYVLYNEQGIYW